MKVYSQFLKTYYRINKMQFLGPIMILMITCGILFGSITANKMVTEKTEAYFYNQYGMVTEIVRLKEERFKEEDSVLKDCPGKERTAYLQTNGVYEKQDEITFINVYGVDDSFFEVYPFDKTYKLEGNNVLISSDFAAANKLKAGSTIHLKIYGETKDYKVGEIGEGDFFEKEKMSGIQILMNKDGYRKNFGISQGEITTLAGKDIKIADNKKIYTVESVRENVSVLSQIQTIQLVVLLIDAIIFLVSTYILFGFYRMAFIGKLHYMSVLNIIGIQKKKLIGLMWLENLVLMTIIYSILSIISYLIQPLELYLYGVIYGILLLTVALANIFITRLFQKTAVLPYILGREEIKIKKGLAAFVILSLVLIGACFVNPKPFTFTIAGINLLFGIPWMLMQAKKSSLQLIKHLNRERIVNEMKAILILAVISLLLVYSAIYGVQQFITGIYGNWKFDEIVTVNQEETHNIKSYLDDNEVEYGEFYWKNYALDPLEVKKGVTIDDLLGIDNASDLSWFGIDSDGINIQKLREGNIIYLNDKYKKYELSETVQLEGETYEIAGYFNSNMNATGNVAIISEESYRGIEEDKVSQLYLKDDDTIVNRLYGEYGDNILGIMDAQQTRSQNSEFANTLQSILMLFILFIALISILSLLNSFFILRDKQKRLFAVLGASGLTKRKLMGINSGQIVVLGIQGLLIAEILLVLVLWVFEWLIQEVIGQNILLVTTWMMQVQTIVVYIFVLMVVWLANHCNLKKMNVLQTIRER